MEHKGRADGVIFEQICKVNELDPRQIEAEAAKKAFKKYENDAYEELLIWTALDYKARMLVQSTSLGESAGKESEFAGKLYTIDGDPAAPAFIINEERIRSTHAQEQADQLIEALGQVRLPVRA